MCVWGGGGGGVCYIASVYNGIPLICISVCNSSGSRVSLLKTPIPASYIAVEEAVGVIRERCYRDDQTPVLKSEQFRYGVISCADGTLLPY